MKLKCSLLAILSIISLAATHPAQAADAPAAAVDAPAAAAAAKEQKIEWAFEIKEDAEATPRGKVFLSVNGKKTLIIDNAIGNYAVIQAADYKDKRIPKKAVAACGAWWAGSGETFYAAVEKGSVKVYQSTSDSQSGDGKFKLVKTIPAS